MEFRENDKKTLSNIMLKCELGKWYDIDPKRKDFDELVGSIKRVIDVFGVAEFRDSTYTSFRRIEKFERHLQVKTSRKHSNLYGSFYTDAYLPDRISDSMIRDNTDKKPIPGLCARPDICERIMSEYNDNSDKDKRIKEMEKSQKFNEWLNN